MKLRSLLVSLSLVSLLCVGLVFKSTTGAGAAPGALSQAIIKQVVTRQANHIVDGTISSPKSISLTFESVRIGTTRTANKADEYEGIPRSATIYPVRVKYTAVYHYTTENSTNKFYYDYLFFKDSFNEWKTLGLGPVR